MSMYQRLSRMDMLRTKKREIAHFSRFTFSLSNILRCKKVMEGWTTQMGFPLVEVVSRSTNGDGSVVLNLKQSW